MNTFEQMAQHHARLIGQRLATFRKYAGLSQQDVADQLGTTQNLIYRMENDLSSSISMIFQVCHYYKSQYQLNFDWLFNPESADTEFAPMTTHEELSLRKKLSLKDRRVLALTNKLVSELRSVDERYAQYQDS